MKRIILSAALITVLAGFQGTAGAQNSGSKTSAHKIGLIDMARVFKEYEKFGVLRDDLKSEIQKTDQEAKSLATKIQKLQGEMKQFKEGSPDFLKRETEMTRLTTEFEAFRKSAKREFVRKESQIYRTIYLEALDVVKKYAEYYKYTLVLRYNGRKLDSGNPQELIQNLNRQVVYHRPEDDITDSVIEYLNRQYGTQAKGSTGTQTK